MTADTPRGGAEFAQFLLARIAEDADRARTFLADNHEALKRAGAPWPSMALAGVERVLAECAAKRAIVDRYVDNLDLALSYRKLPTTGYAAADRLEHQLQEARLATSLEACVALVAVYADHPDYDDTWIPR